MSDADVRDYGGVASRKAAQEFGGFFTRRESAVNVGVGAVQILPADSNRVGFVITNTGTTNITVRSDPAVAAGVGQLMLGNGALITSNWFDDGDTVSQGLYAVGNLAGGSVFIVEMVQVSKVDRAGA